jgi:hypothetical protein
MVHIRTEAASGRQQRQTARQSAQQRERLINIHDSDVIDAWASVVSSSLRPSCSPPSGCAVRARDHDACFEASRAATSPPTEIFEGNGIFGRLCCMWVNGLTTTKKKKKN